MTLFYRNEYSMTTWSYELQLKEELILKYVLWFHYIRIIFTSKETSKMIGSNYPMKIHPISMGIKKNQLVICSQKWRTDISFSLV